MQRTAIQNVVSIMQLALLVVLGQHAMAGQVHALFGREILGLPWTASSIEIAAALPGGKWSGTPQTYTVADSSTVFQIRRTSRQTITVTLNASGRLDSVTIGFPPGGETHLDLLENLSDYLGEPSPADTSVTREAGTPHVRTTWEENGIRVTLVHVIVTPTFTRNEVIVARVPAL
jgi:hypothetical protein